jgi:hypothetical protein
MTNYSGTYAKPRVDLGVAFMEYMAEDNEFIGLQVLGKFSSPVRAANFPKVTRKALLQNPDVKREMRANYQRIETESTDDDFSCKEYGAEIPIDDGERALYSSDFDSDMVGTKAASRSVLLAHEKRVAAAVFNTTLWTGSALQTDVAVDWDTPASAVPITNVVAAKEKVRAGTGMKANALILAQSQFENLLINAQILARFPGAALITEEMIRANMASIFGLKYLLIGGAVYDSASQGSAFSGTDVWTDDYAMVARVALADAPLSEPCIGRSVIWTPDAPEEIVIEQYREEQKKSDIIRARNHMNEFIIDPAFGHLMIIDT